MHPGYGENLQIMSFFYIMALRDFTPGDSFASRADQNDETSPVDEKRVYIRTAGLRRKAISDRASISNNSRLLDALPYLRNSVPDQRPSRH